jgi:hypothetical protein
MLQAIDSVVLTSRKAMTPEMLEVFMLVEIHIVFRVETV